MKLSAAMALGALLAARCHGEEAAANREAAGAVPSGLRGSSSKRFSLVRVI